MIIFKAKKFFTILTVCLISVGSVPSTLQMTCSIFIRGLDATLHPCEKIICLCEAEDETPKAFLNAHLPPEKKDPLFPRIQETSPTENFIFMFVQQKTMRCRAQAGYQKLDFPPPRQYQSLFTV